MASLPLVANSGMISDTFSVSLEGKSFKQNSQKSHAKSLKELRLKYNEYDLKESIKPILNNSGCLKYLD